MVEVTQVFFTVCIPGFFQINKGGWVQEQKFTSWAGCLLNNGHNSSLPKSHTINYFLSFSPSIRMLPLMLTTLKLFNLN